MSFVLEQNRSLISTLRLKKAPPEAVRNPHGQSPRQQLVGTTLSTPGGGESSTLPDLPLLPVPVSPVDLSDRMNRGREPRSQPQWGRNLQGHGEAHSSLQSHRGARRTLLITASSSLLFLKRICSVLGSWFEQRKPPGVKI